jgi:hypothetical protein
MRVHRLIPAIALAALAFAVPTTPAQADGCLDDPNCVETLTYPYVHFSQWCELYVLDVVKGPQLCWGP